MFQTTATITGSTLVVVERNEAGLTTALVLEVARPENFRAAEIELAMVGLAVASAWELDGDNISAPVRKLDNEFNGVRAAKIWAAVGTTHEEFELAPASTVENGDIITDSEFSDAYVVGGSSTECGVTKLHQVAEGKGWDDRYTGEFSGLVQVARRKA
jgi:hypothetical protein